jgi:hypothetical protein
MDSSIAGTKDLNRYGTPCFAYQGSGEITFSDKTRFPCRFQAGQYSCGRIIILLECDHRAMPQDFNSCIEFRGISSEGFQVVSSGNLHEINYLPDLPENSKSGTWASLEATKLDVACIANSDISKLNFFLTNVALPPRPLHPPLPVERASLMRISDYDKVMPKLQVCKDVQITAELCCEISSDADSQVIMDCLDPLCAVLSIARGTRVQWVLYEQIDREGNMVRRCHHAKITKNYGGLNLIHPTRLEDNQSFLDVALPACKDRKNQYALNPRTINAYLDAKAEGDFLELRGAKLAVAMELLRSSLLGEQESPIQANIIDEDHFKELLPEIESAIRQVCGNHTSSDEKIAICAKLPGLNRRSFSNHIRKLIRSLKLQIPVNDQRLFISCRNKLVHEGAYYCKAATSAERKDVQALKSPVQEYFFLVHFLDRIFLRMLGYSGAYLDWSYSQPPKLRTLEVVQ